MQKYIFILLILFMSCTTDPIDQHNDNAVLQSFLKIGDNDKIIPYDMDGNGTVDCMELPDETIADSLFCVWADGRITQLNLYNIGLSGPIPESIGGLDQLVMLGLSSNKLIGEIPESIGNLAKLGQLNLANNQLSGIIPESMGKLKGLWNLNLENNQLSGSIPEAIASLPILISILLNNNQLSLEITDIICNRYSDLDTLNITGNQLCPPFPSCIDSPDIIGQQECQGLDCEDGYTAINSYCYANSDLSVLQILIDNSHPDSLNIKMDADTSGSTGYETIEPLELGKQVWHAGRLETLDCYYWNTDSSTCNLSQSLSEIISNLTELTTLDFEANNLIGDLPKTFGDMPKLTSLNLSSNQFVNYIPKEICNIYTAQHDFNLENNSLCPCYPECLTEADIGEQNTSECFHCNEGYNQICTNLPSNVTLEENSICFIQSNIDILQTFIESSMSTLDINIMDLDSSNVIDWFELGIQNWSNGNLQSLKVNNLQLSGGIPDSIGALTNLITLHLHENQLSGQIPESICDLTLNWAADSTNENKSYIFHNQFCKDPTTDEWPSCIEDYVGTQNTDNCPTGSE